MIERAVIMAILVIHGTLGGVSARAQTAVPAGPTTTPQAPPLQHAVPPASVVQGSAQPAPMQPAQVASPPTGDACLSARIETAYLLNPYLSRYPIEVTTDNGTARLRGQVENEVERGWAEALARSMPGVEAVVNELEVTSRPQLDEGRSRIEQQMRDATITARVKMRLLWHRETHDLDTNVETENGTVRLTGHVNSTDQSDLAATIARRTDGVEGVRNHLLVMIPKGTADEKVQLAPAGPGVLPPLPEHIDDAWITRVVSTGIGFIRGIDPVDIDVTTADRVVTLTGTVLDPEDSVRAVDFARDLIGVEEVRNQIIVKTP